MATSDNYIRIRLSEEATDGAREGTIARVRLVRAGREANTGEIAR